MTKESYTSRALALIEDAEGSHRPDWSECSNKTLDLAREAADEIERLTRDMAALQSQWDDMQQGLVEVFGEPVRDAIELLGATERVRGTLERLRQAKLTWGIACHCECAACDTFWEAFSAGASGSDA